MKSFWEWISLIGVVCRRVLLWIPDESATLHEGTQQGSTGLLVKAGAAERLENKKRSKEAQEEMNTKGEVEGRIKKIGLVTNKATEAQKCICETIDITQTCTWSLCLQGHDKHDLYTADVETNLHHSQKSNTWVVIFMVQKIT